MKTIQTAFILIVIFILGGLSSTQAQNYDEKTIKKAFQPKGTHRSPFKNKNEVGLTSVNIQFKLATRQEANKKKVGNIVTWGLLDGITDEHLQQITDEYYTLLLKKLESIGYTHNQEFINHKSYQKLVEDNQDNNRETEKKNWGVAKVFTSNKMPYIEYPIGVMGSHASLGNDLKYPVGQLFITIDFLSIKHNIQRGLENWRGERTDKFETNVLPVIKIEGITSENFAKQFKGDGTYAKFRGGNWSYCNAIINRDYEIESNIDFVNDVLKTQEMPQQLQKFKSKSVGDIASILSGGVIKSGRGLFENTFTIIANPEAYKKAVLDALEKFNDHLISYIKQNN